MLWVNLIMDSLAALALAPPPNERYYKELKKGWIYNIKKNDEAYCWISSILISN